LAAMPGRAAAAVAAWILMRSATASVLIVRAVPRAVNTKPPGSAGFSRCHCRSPVMAGAWSGVRRSLRPLVRHEALVRREALRVEGGGRPSRRAVAAAWWKLSAA
jgi:hypothetical protein